MTWVRELYVELNSLPGIERGPLIDYAELAPARALLPKIAQCLAECDLRVAYGPTPGTSILSCCRSLEVR